MNITLPKTEEWQKEVINAYIEHQNNTIITVLSKRQCGKSVCMEILLLYAALSKQSTSICVSPKLEQSRKIFNDICKMLRRTPLIVRKNETLLNIELINGSQILFKSAEQKDTLRGYTVSGVLCIDEAAFINDDVFYELLLPWTNVHQASIVLTSTPKFKQGFFYENYMRGLNEEKGNITIDWGSFDTSKYLSNEKLEMYKQQMPKSAFISEFLGQFCDADSLVFGDFKGCIKETKINPNYEVIMSIDWGSGSGQDDTAITLLQYIDDKVVVPCVFYFNDLKVKDTILEIKKLVDKYKVSNIIVEKNSIGKIYFDVMCEEFDSYDITITTFVTTNNSKNKIINELVLDFEQNKIEIPNNKKLINELSFFESSITKNNNVTFNAKIGQHDDLVISLAIGNNFIKKLNI